MSTGFEQIKQRIIRRLCSNPAFKLADKTPIPADYIFEQEYGNALRRKIGEPYNRDIQESLEQAVNQAIVIDEGLAVSRPPVVEIFKVGVDQVWIRIGVTLKTGQSGAVIFTVV